jgi:hypothetical protein
MPLSPSILSEVTGQPAAAAWSGIAAHLREEFFAPIAGADAEGEVVGRDRRLAGLDNVLSGSAWDLWQEFEGVVPRASQGTIAFWNGTTSGKAVIILDGLSLREAPWLLEQARGRGYKLHRSEVRGAELPGETTPFARSLGFAQRSALDNNEAGAAHKLTGAFTACSNLPWKDCVEMVGAQSAVVFWHHWPDERLHDLSGPGLGLRKLAKEAHAALVSDDFWSFVDRLATGRRLVITSDHGYAACGEFHDLTGDQATYMKSVFKSGRSAPATGKDASWVPPIDLSLKTAHGSHQFVLGRRKWKSAAGYPTLQHGGLSLLELFVPFLEISK